MSSVYSTSFLRSHGGAGGLYTVPDGFIAVVRNVTAFNSDGVIPQSFNVYLGHSSCTFVAATLSPLLPSSPGYYSTWELRVVVETTDTINVSNDPGVDVTVNGYLLSLP